MSILSTSMKINSTLKALERSQHFSHYKSMGIFSDAQGRVTHKPLIESCPISNPCNILRVSLLPARMKKIQSKMKGNRVVTTLFIDLSHAQGQLTPKSVMESCRNSNPSKLLWLTLLPARMKKIQWKMKVLEWSQCFSHYKSMEIFTYAQGQLTHKPFFGYSPILNPSEILWVSLLPARIKKIQSKMKALEWSQHYSLIFHTIKGS